MERDEDDIIMIDTDVIEGPKLETERLILKSMSLADVDFLLYHFGAEETNWYTEYERLKNREEAIDFYYKFIEPGKKTYFRLVITLKKNDTLIGTIGFFLYNRRDSSAEIGYDLSRLYWRKGITTEAVKCLVNYGFEQMNLYRIEVTADPENIGSIKILKNLAFKKEGQLKEKHYYMEKYHDESIYSLLQRDWEKVKSIYQV